MVFAKLCLFTMLLQGATALRLREAAPPEFAGENVCTGPHAQQLIKDKGVDKKMPKVAWVIAEKLDRFPLRHTERMDRLAEPLEGADLFVAAEYSDKSSIEFLPKATRVGLFNYSWQSFREGLDNMGFQNKAPDIDVKSGSFYQFIRMQEAMDLIKEQEAKQGWKYDIIFRLRTEMIVKDICREGRFGGCQGRGKLLRIMAAETDPKTIIHAGDWYELGFREEIMNLAKEFRFPLTNEGFKVSCETDKDKEWDDVRQCVLEKEAEKKAWGLTSPNPQIVEKKVSLGEGLEGHESAAEIRGQMENHVMRTIDRLGYKNRFNGKSLSAGVVAIRRFHNDYDAGEIENAHAAHGGCTSGVYPPVGDA